VNGTIPVVQPKPESRPDWQIALAITAVLRVFYSLTAAVLSFYLRPDPALIHSNALTENLPQPGGLHFALLGIWERFDTLWYLRISERGYDLPHAVIFYPLYPAAIRAISWAVPATAAMLLVATIAAYFYLWGLLRLGNNEFTGAGRLRLLLMITVWPTSFVLFAGYAESLTLALMMWAVVFARARRWELATICGILAGLGRPSGVLVSIPLVIMALRSRQLRAAITFFTPVGLLGFWAWLHWTGRPSVVEAYRQYQGAALAPPWASVAEALRLIASEHDALLAIKLGLVILVAILSLRRGVRLEDRLFSLAVILQLLMYTGRPLLGAARYLLPVYPAFVSLGAYAQQRWNHKQLVFYVVVFAFLNLMWFRAFLNWSLVF